MRENERFYAAQAHHARMRAEQEGAGLAGERVATGPPGPSEAELLLLLLR